MFVTITRQQFEDFLPEGFETKEPPRTQELVYQIPTDKANLAVRIYSSVDKKTNVTREYGSDAVRLVFWDCLNDRPVGKSTRINRVEGKTTVGERIKAKIKEYLSDTENQTIVDLDYVRAVLEANTWSPFAESLLENLDKYRKLSDNQLAYILGDKNPKGKNTFEALCRRKNPNFVNDFYNKETVDDRETHREDAGRDDDRQRQIDSVFEEEAGSGTTETAKAGQQVVVEPKGQAEKQHQNILIKSDGTDIELVPTKEHSYYQYPFEKFNPVQSIVYRHKEEDKNVLVGANTSAGKTIAAELVIDEVLQTKKKVVYLSPLKSLTQEKYDDWSVRYENKTLTIMTGDYSLSEKMKKQLADSDIIVMTSEMMDSRTRKMMYEKNFWLREVGLVIADECFPGSTKVRIAKNYEVPIKDIVENESFKYVLSYNEKTKTLEKKKILRKIKKDSYGNFVRIKYKDNFGIMKTLVCTANHKIWTDKGYKRADLLNSNDIIKFFPVDRKNYCEVCEKQWDDYSGGFNHHYYLQHIVEQNKFECGICNRKFKRTEDLKNHKCDALKRNVCSICNRKFTSIDFLKKHYIETHKKLFTYKCKECTAKFKSKAKLFSHTLKNHRGEKFFLDKERKRKESIDWKKFGESISNSPKHAAAMKKVGLQRKGKNNPLFLHNNRGLKKMTIAKRKYWNNLPEYKKEEQIKRFINAPLFRKGKKTSLEQKINDYGFNDLYYTGDGSFFVTFKNGKKKNPDFKVKGQKKVIEVGDFEYWHSWPEANEVINQYEKIGYKCLYISSYTMKNKWSAVVKKINTFIANHDCEIIEVAKWGSAKIKYVYNLEIEGNHNYIANNVLVSNCHILTTDRGHAVEAGIMRFSRINPEARIVFLSATMPNVEELGDWLSLLNGKETVVINCNWRPVELQITCLEHPVYKNYYDTQDTKRKMAVETVMSKPEEKFLVFVHDKTTGRDVVRRLNMLGEQAVFHSAESDLKTKNETESKFRDRNNGIRVLVSTSVIAWGCNLPARNVVICGVHRGIQEVDELDIIQMAGRAGRYGIDDAGFVFLIVPTGTTTHWKSVFVNPRPVTSVLNKHATMAFHALAEIATRQIDSIPSLHAWYSRSLAYKQGQEFTMDAAKFLMEDLFNMQMVSDVYAPKLRSLGKVSAGLYFSPYDVWKWYNNFQALKDLQDRGEAVNDSVLSWAVGDVPGNDMGYVPKDVENDFLSLRTVVYGYLSKAGRSGNEVTLALVSAVGCYANLQGENSNGTLGVVQRNVKYDIDRTVQALSWIDRAKGEWKFDKLWQVLPIRVKYGVPMELVDLIRLPGIGAVRAKKIYELGVTSVKDVANTDNGKKLKKVFADKFIKQLQKYAREELENEQHS